MKGHTKETQISSETETLFRIKDTTTKIKHTIKAAIWPFVISIDG
jgi:hypothetical protein